MMDPCLIVHLVLSRFLVYKSWRFPSPELLYLLHDELLFSSQHSYVFRYKKSILVQRDWKIIKESLKYHVAHINYMCDTDFCSRELERIVIKKESYWIINLSKKNLHIKQ